MTGKPPDLQAEALKTLEAFASSCDGRAKGEVFDAFILMAARCVNAAAVLLEIDNPDDRRCPLCRAAGNAKDVAHEMAERFAISGGERLN
jgi:hypothetical protein